MSLESLLQRCVIGNTLPHNNQCIPPFIVKLPFTFKVIDVVPRRAYILSQVGVGNYPKLDVELLTKLYRYTDKYFFNSMIENLLSQSGSTLKIEVSKQMTCTAGKLKTERNNTKREYTLRFSESIMETITEESVKRSLKNGGIVVQNRLHAIQLTVEHELLHLLIDLSTDGKKEAPHGELFQTMALQLFGHTDFYHGLLSEEKADIDLNFKLGERVCFGHKGATLYGVVVKLNPKTVGVLLDDTRRCNVSYSLLTRVKT